MDSIFIKYNFIDMRGLCQAEPASTDGENRTGVCKTPLLQN